MDNGNFHKISLGGAQVFCQDQNFGGNCLFSPFSCLFPCKIYQTAYPVLPILTLCVCLRKTGNTATAKRKFLFWWRKKPFDGKIETDGYLRGHFRYPRTARNVSWARYKVVEKIINEKFWCVSPGKKGWYAQATQKSQRGAKILAKTPKLYGKIGE